MREWLRKNVHFLALTLGICTVLESYFHLIGDRVQLPGDRAGEMWAIIGIGFLGLAWWTRPQEHHPHS